MWQGHLLKIVKNYDFEQNCALIDDAGGTTFWNSFASKIFLRDVAVSQPAVLIINDDQSLLESRRLLLEACGAKVLTACGEMMAIHEAIVHPVDLVLIDATNVGLEHGEKICSMVREIRPEQQIGLLVQPEIETPMETNADRVIHRTGPRRMLVEANEMLEGRLNVDLWRDESA